jgi:hypothetical protein
MTPADREAWRLNAIRTRAAKAGLERAIRVAIPIEEGLPGPIADALRRAEEAVADKRKAS